MSVYLHSVYDNFHADTYHDAAQRRGKLNHAAIDRGIYTTSKHVLQGLPVYSHRYNLAGKIDNYDQKKKEIVERKTLIKKIYDGYRYQMYAQYFCLVDMGYEVQKLFLHSLQDNKRYSIEIPGKDATQEFERILKAINNFSVNNYCVRTNKEKCSKCIYRNLCA